MTNGNRPLSPHLGIYRWPITMALSILHRGSGIALAVGLLVMLVWLMSMAGGPETYLTFHRSMNGWFGHLLSVAWTLAFFYHLSNGIRHLAWDSGYGFEKAQANRSSLFVLASTLVLTAIFWVVAL